MTDNQKQFAVRSTFKGRIAAELEEIKKAFEDKIPGIDTTTVLKACIRHTYKDLKEGKLIIGLEIDD